MSAIAQMFKKARSVVLRRGVTPEDADDIVQEAFARLTAYTRAHELRSQEAFLVKAAVNISRDQVRRKRKSPFDPAEVDFDLVADSEPRQDEVVRAQERLRRAAAGMERLSPLALRILMAQRVEGLSFPQIARQEGMSVAAVEKQLARAVMFLTKWMDGW